MARMYQPLWQTLKQTSVVVVAAHPKQHQRIFKAISKEKWMDNAYAIWLEDKGKVAELNRSSSGNALTIKLVISATLQGCI